MTTHTLLDTRLSLYSPLVPAVTEGAEPEAAREPSSNNGAWDHVLDELLRLRTLPGDWDGQGAEAPSRSNVDAAIRWVKEMRLWRHALPPTQTVPGTTGEVVLEWRGDAFHLAAEISTPDRIEWLLNLPGHAVRQWDTDLRCTWVVRAER
jgi:hypothetical protein